MQGMIRQASDLDCEQLAGIYNYYINETVITFDEEPVSARDMRARLDKVRDSGLPWLVAEEDGVLVGYAYASNWQARSAYRRTVEISVYLSYEQVSKGWGTKLYQELFEILNSKAYHVALAGVTLPNAASEALHAKFGMKQVAHFHEVGFKFDRWLDVGYWQKKLGA